MSNYFTIAGALGTALFSAMLGWDLAAIAWAITGLVMVVDMAWD